MNSNDQNIVEPENNSNNEIDFSTDDKEITRFKTMYYSLNTTPDTQMKVFNDGKIIRLEDIVDLHRKVNGKMEIMKLL